MMLVVLQDGLTALLCASRHGHDSTAALLLERGKFCWPSMAWCLLVIVQRGVSAWSVVDVCVLMRG